jgi:hypothetical protein
MIISIFKIQDLVERKGNGTSKGFEMQNLFF